jgi:peptidoglycan hydrolase-like protein with peptidoglycan-binding domain
MRSMLAASILGLSLCTIPVLPQSRDTVRDAQQALKDKGFDPGPVDGINGPLTRAAVRNYQQKENINADGRLGPKTLDSLGVKGASASTEFGTAGEKLKNSYAKGAKDMGHGTKEAGSDLKHGDVVEGAKDFGKGVGHGVGKMAVGTGRAAKNAAKGSKKAVTGDSKPKQ